MYSLISIVVFIVLGIIWTKSDWRNFALKLGFFAMAVWGLVETNVIAIAV